MSIGMKVINMNKNIDVIIDMINTCPSISFNRSLLIAMLKAFYNQTQILNDKKQFLYELQSKLICKLINDEQQVLLYGKTKKIAVRMRKLLNLTNHYYDNYRYALIKILESEIAMKQMKLKLYEETKQDIMLLKLEINALINEIRIMISHIDGYRNSYKAIRRLVTSYKISKNELKKNYYDNLLKEKEKDYLLLGRLRKSLVRVEKTLQEQDRRWNSTLIKLNSAKENECAGIY